MRIATWNINSLRLRMPILAKLVAETAPDVVCLQETKVHDDQFPFDDVRALGFEHIAINGIKGYNGVCILSKLPLADVGRHDWTGKADGRHIFATLPTGLEVHSLYVPAGGDEPDRESIDASMVADEMKRLHLALDTTQREIEELQRVMAEEESSAESEIFETHGATGSKERRTHRRLPSPALDMYRDKRQRQTF